MTTGSFRVQMRWFQVALAPLFALTLAVLLTLTMAIDSSDLTVIGKGAKMLVPIAALYIVSEAVRLSQFIWRGPIRVTETGLVLPWFWTEQRRCVPWSRIHKATVDEIRPLRIATVRLRLIGDSGNDLAHVSRRWVGNWDQFVSEVRKHVEAPRRTH